MWVPRREGREGGREWRRKLDAKETVGGKRNEVLE